MNSREIRMRSLKVAAVVAAIGLTGYVIPESVMYLTEESPLSAPPTPAPRTVTADGSVNWERITRIISSLTESPSSNPSVIVQPRDKPSFTEALIERASRPSR